MEPLDYLERFLYRVRGWRGGGGNIAVVNIRSFGKG